jgi:hypothetical protein
MAKSVSPKSNGQVKPNSLEPTQYGKWFDNYNKFAEAIIATRGKLFA